MGGVDVGGSMKRGGLFFRDTLWSDMAWVLSCRSFCGAVESRTRVPVTSDVRLLLWVEAFPPQSVKPSKW